MPAYAVKKGPTHRTSPSTLALIIAGHLGAFALLMTAGGPIVERFTPTKTKVDLIPMPPPPPPEVVPETIPEPAPTPLLVTPTPLVEVPVSDPIIMVQVPTVEPGPVTVTPNAGPGSIKLKAAPAISEARLTTPSHLIEPPYPAAKQNAGEEARLQLLLAINAKGRVTAVTPIGQADPIFVEAARKHILRHWRYRPAMQGSVPVATEKSIALTFTLRD